jgi:uncharacterized protein (TIGR02594 family)
MSPWKKRLALALCGVTLAAFTNSAFAKPRHVRHGHVRHVASTTTLPSSLEDARFAAPEGGASAGVAQASANVAEASGQLSIGGSSSLVNEARRYLGGNPTGRGSLWCGAFMDLVLKRTGHAGGGNLARAYSRYGSRVSGPQIGAIAVMGRHGGGHVGVVSGVDANGNPIIISGNHNHRVAESVYPKGRIIAYVKPD